jgi:hypothetical protein
MLILGSPLPENEPADPNEEWFGSTLQEAIQKIDHNNRDKDIDLQLIKHYDD